MATKPFLSQIAVPVGTTTGDVYYPQTSLLMHFNGTNGSTTMTDSSKNTVTVTATNGASISTVQSKFGGSSGLFDGTNDYCTIPDNSAFDFGSSDFTIEYWEYRTVSTIYKPVLSRNTGGYPPFMIGWSDTGNVYFYSSTDGASWNVASAVSMGVIITNAWTHYAVTRNGNTFRTFQNGTQISTFTSTATLPAGAGTLLIGAYATPAYFFQGYIDELRITKGIARYTSNFTPPTTQFLDSAGDANSSVVVNSTATGFAIGTGGINGAQLAKAWVNFSGSSPAVIRDSYNVSSITNNGTGDYTINYATTFSNANYCVNASAREFAIFAAAGGNITTGSVKVSVYNSAIALANTTHVFVSVFGN